MSSEFELCIDQICPLSAAPSAVASCDERAFHLNRLLVFHAALIFGCCKRLLHSSLLWSRGVDGLTVNAELFHGVVV